jgi:pimeloyl-ACP methyl ester carboxylesterase
VPGTSADGVSVHYEVHGDGPALVLCPGGGGNHAAWWQQVPHFRDRYTVVALDFPGYGGSDKAADEYDAREFPPSILAVLDDAGIDRAILMGQSIGCGPALSIAVTHPDRVLGVIVAQSSGGISDEGIAQASDADRQDANRNYNGAAGETMWSDEFRVGSPAEVFLYRQLGTFNKADHARVKHTNDWTTTAQQVRDAIAAGVSVNFLQATGDRVVTRRTYDRIREVLPDAHVEVIDGGSHLAYWQSPEIFNAGVDRILERIGRAA